ncbi:MAG: helix-hairpin-helix domain-containing protein [bacterium]|nr:helix-hairpin-helix domain-containing protein [bacterium]
MLAETTTNATGKKEIFSNKEIHRVLRNVAASYLILNENKFKVIAYQKAADTVEHLTRELHDIWQEGSLKDVPGIGPSIGSHIDEYFRTGRSSHFEKVFKGIPPSVFALMKVPTIGPKTAFKLAQELHISYPKKAVEKLEEAAKKGRIRSIPTFGEKSEGEIIQAIEAYKKGGMQMERMVLPYAHERAVHLMDYLKKNPLIKRIDALGSMRRMVSTIGDIDIAAVITDETKSSEVIHYFTQYEGTTRIDNAGEAKASIIVPPHIRVDLRIQSESTYGTMLQYFTGSKAHNIKLRDYANKIGFSISEYGVKPTRKFKNSNYKKYSFNRNKEMFEFSNEETLYEFLGLPFIPPEIREGTNEIDLAKKNGLPLLVELKDIRGDFHIHSSYDISTSHDVGKNTYKEIFQNADTLGYEYVGFADHNPKTSGSTSEDITAIMKKRKADIEKQLSSLKQTELHYFIGLEVDILTSGELALPAGALEYVDYLIVSVHSVFSMDVEQMTKRILKALSFPKVKILGHPTGRLLTKRNGYKFDWNQICKEAVERNIGIEINAWPERLDASDSMVRSGIEKGVQFFINTDAHANEQMGNMLYGVEVARRGWASKSDIINTLSYKKVKEWLECC